MWIILIILVLSYLAGSIPTAIIVCKIVMKDDIRKHGSKNAGATNVFRVMGWKPALVVVLVDVGKGIASVLGFARIGIGMVPLDLTGVQILAGLAVIVGHIWTVFAGFRGGKGVGTAFGVLLSLAPAATGITGILWLVLVFTTRIVSIGSIAAGIVFPIVLMIQKRFFDPYFPNRVIILGILLGILILVTHRSNIRRLFRGKENRFGTVRRDSEASGS